MIRSLIISFAVLGAVAGCNVVVVQDEPAPRSGYYDGEFDYATGKGAMLTFVSGNPFGGPQQEFDDRVRRLMYGQNRGLPTEFVGSRSERTMPPYKIVVAFNKELHISPSDMCAKPLELRSVPEKTRLRIDIAFCHGDDPKSDTSGYVSGVSGIDDPKFADLVRQATLTMLPIPGDTKGDRDSGERFP